MCCKCGAKSCVFCGLLTITDEVVDGRTPVVQKNAHIEDMCSICDCEYGDYKYFPKRYLTFYGKYHPTPRGWEEEKKYILDTVTLELTSDDVKQDISKVPVLACQDYYRYKLNTETFFIGNGDILGTFFYVERGDMCGYRILPFGGYRMYVLSEGLKDNMDDRCMIMQIPNDRRLYYFDIFNKQGN